MCRLRMILLAAIVDGRLLPYWAGCRRTVFQVVLPDSALSLSIDILRRRYEDGVQRHTCTANYIQ